MFFAFLFINQDDRENQWTAWINSEVSNIFMPNQYWANPVTPEWTAEIIFMLIQQLIRFLNGNPEEKLVYPWAHEGNISSALHRDPTVLSDLCTFCPTSWPYGTFRPKHFLSYILADPTVLSDLHPDPTVLSDPSTFESYKKSWSDNKLILRILPKIIFWKLKA